jgi:hypothetical protein
MLDWLFVGIHQDHFRDGVAGLECLFARQPNFFRAYQNVFHLAEGPTNYCFTDTIELRNMKFRSIFSPVHQRHQQLIGSAQFWRSAEVTQSVLKNLEHFFKSCFRYACETLEICVLELFDCFAFHVPSMAHLCNRPSE